MNDPQTDIDMAMAYAQEGEWDRAYKWLNQATARIDRMRDNWVCTRCEDWPEFGTTEDYIQHLRDVHR